MAFPHPKSGKRDCWNRHIPNNGSVIWKFLKGTINITDDRNREDEVNPAKYGTHGGFSHHWFVIMAGLASSVGYGAGERWLLRKI